MKILVIGAAGFIGKFLTNRLIKEGHKVIGFDINPASEKQKNLYKCITGNILSPDAVLRATNGVDMIITLAAKHHDFGVTREEFFKVNESGTKILLDCASKSEVKNIIFYSTVAVYGTHKEPTTEDTLPVPDNDYGKSKLAAEQLIYKWVEEDKTRCAVIIRPTVVFGPQNYGNVYNLIDKIYRKKFLFVGVGNNIKSVAYVENLVDTNIFLLDKLKPGIQIFNYSDEPQKTITQIVETITKNLPYGIPKIKIPLILAVTLGSILDMLAKLTGYNSPITSARMKKFSTLTHHKSEKIRKFGFQQKIEIKEGFRKMVEWYLDTQT
ncbi:N-acetyl-alpha-D-glucosaminyl-diphospho-ditrans,octacis-undecaprenol 4-epimerase [subsurface metagenome]